MPDPYPPALSKLTNWLLWGALLASMVLLDRVCHAAEPAPDFDKVVDAIYLAEGGSKAVKPFGILSVPCAGYAECRRICRNTVRNNYRRWQAAGSPGDYLSFLAARYAPTKGATNDPQGLNRHWLKNVRAILARSR